MAHAMSAHDMAGTHDVERLTFVSHSLKTGGRGRKIRLVVDRRLVDDDRPDLLDGFKSPLEAVIGVAVIEDRKEVPQRTHMLAVNGDTVVGVGQLLQENTQPNHAGELVPLLLTKRRAELLGAQ